MFMLIISVGVAVIALSAVVASVVFVHYNTRRPIGYDLVERDDVQAYLDDEWELFLDHPAVLLDDGFLQPMVKYER